MTITFPKAPSNGASKLFIPINSFVLVEGGVAFTNTSNFRGSGWRFDASTQERIAAHFGGIPVGWSTVDVILWWQNESSGSGDVMWNVEYRSNAAGETTSVAVPSVGTQTVTAGGQYVLVKTTCATSVSVDPDELQQIRVSRIAGNAADTLANDATLLAVQLVKS